MITHIIYGSDIPKTSIDRIKELIEKEKGILRFRFHAVDDWHLEQGDTLSLSSLFEHGRRFRMSKGNLAEDFVITLTDRPNVQNFYASLDPTDNRTGFIHTGDWELFIDCERELPVTFTIVNLLIAYHTSPNFEQMYDFLHHRPIGCANDLCFNKREVIFKLRTGDVCADCIRAMQANGWSDLGIDHAMRILTMLSQDMRFNRYFQPVMEPSRMRIDMNDGGSVTLPEYGDLELNIPPIDLTYYLFFLRYSGDEGFFQKVFSDDWAKTAIYIIYEKLRPLMSERELRATAKNFENKELREQCKSRINRIITEALGSRLAKPYLIEGQRGKPFKVALQLTKVEVLNFKEWLELPSGPDPVF